MKEELTCIQSTREDMSSALFPKICSLLEGETDRIALEELCQWFSKHL